MTENQLNGLAEDVREEGYNSSNSMKDLVFDPVTGEFKQVVKGTHTGRRGGDGNDQQRFRS